MYFEWLDIYQRKNLLRLFALAVCFLVVACACACASSVDNDDRSPALSNGLWISWNRAQYDLPDVRFGRCLRKRPFVQKALESDSDEVFDASEGSDSDECNPYENEPVRKKCKLSGRKLEPCRDILEYLKSRALSGKHSHFSLLCKYLPERRCSELAVLEAVMNVMFRYKRQVRYINKSYFLLPRDTPKIVPNESLAVAIARILLDSEDVKKYSLGSLAYDLSQKGHTADSFRCFKKLFQLLRIICNKQVPKRYLDLVAFLQFVLTVPDWRTEDMDVLVQAHYGPSAYVLSPEKKVFLRRMRNLNQEDINKILHLKCRCKELAVNAESKLFFVPFLKKNDDEAIDAQRESDGNAGVFVDEREVHTVKGCILSILRQTQQEVTHVSGNIFRKYARSGNRETTAEVMGVVFAEDLNITFDELHDVYSFFKAPNRRSQPQEELELFIKDIVLSEKHSLRLGSLAYKVYSAGYRVPHLEVVRSVYNIVRCICCIDSFAGGEIVRNFFNFAQFKEPREKEDFVKERDKYMEKNGYTVIPRCFVWAEKMFFMDPGLLKKLESSKKQGPGAIQYLMRNTRKSLKGMDGKIALRKKIKELAEKEEKCEYKDLKKVVGTNEYTSVIWFQAILNIVFIENLGVETDGIKFKFFPERPQVAEPLVPVEVMIAARFSGDTVDRRSRVIFAKDLYQAGFLFQDFDTFKTIFDTVCVVCDVPIDNIRELENHLGFFEYVKKFPGKKDWKKLQETYGKKVSSYALTLAKNATNILEKGVLRQWGIGLSCEQPREKEACTVVLKILQTYAENKMACPYKVLGLVIHQDCSDKDVLSMVMDTAFKEDVRVHYNEAEKTYMLLKGASVCPKPTYPLASFIVGQIMHDATLDCEVLAFYLHAAGYKVDSFHIVADLFNVYRSVLFYGCDSRVVSELMIFARCVLDYDAESVTNDVPIQNCKCEQPLTPYFKRKFSASFVRLFLSGLIDFDFISKYVRPQESKHLVIEAFKAPEVVFYPKDDLTLGHVSDTLSESPEAFSDDSEDSLVLEGGVDSLGKAPEGFVCEDDGDLALEPMVVRIQKSLYDKCFVDIFSQKVRECMTQNTVWHWREVECYSGRRTGCEGVLEFVLDVIFKNNWDFDFVEKEAGYRFCERKSYEFPQMSSEKIVVNFCAQRPECGPKERVGCIYMLYKSRYRYTSFQEAAIAFGGICVNKGIPVVGLTEIECGRDFFYYIKDLCENHKLGACRNEGDLYRKSGRKLSAEGEAIGWKALAMDLAF